MTSLLTDPLTLPCGATLPNRIAKAAMTEGLADAAGRPTDALARLYCIWSAGGAGLLISGNIQIDRDHLERPGNVVIDGAADSALGDALRRWTEAATEHGNHVWAQISHAGRQTPALVNPHPKAPSAVPLALPGKQFGEPVAMPADEVAAIPERFAIAAASCKQAGFTGVQLHAAHGYLLSQFLNPRANRREDEWGGSLENRARLLMDSVAAVRRTVGGEFPVAVKLNSADFQRGGFAFEDSLQVAQWLEAEAVDLLEISGGSYEQPKMMDMEGLGESEQPDVAQSTARREAYFVDFAKAMRDHVALPLMVTGGFRTRAAMEHALDSGAADVIGLGRPMCYQTDAPRKLLEGAESVRRWEDELRLLPGWLGFLKAIPTIRALDGFAVQYWFYGQLYALGRTGTVDPDLSVWAAFREVERTHRALMVERD